MLADDLLCGLDPVAFAHRLDFTPDAWQERILRSTSDRLLLNCARQSGKSTLAGLMAVWQATYRPAQLILLVSPTLRQSSELFRKCKVWLDAIEPTIELAEDNKLSAVLANDSRIVSLPSNPEGIRGFSSVNLVIEDEAAFCGDDLYTAIRPMLAVSRGRLMLMSTPFGKRGHFFDEWSGAGQWERVMLKAFGNPRISKTFLEDEQRALGEWRFKQEYECEFVDNQSSLFSYDLIQQAMSDKVKPLFDVSPIESAQVISDRVKPLFA